MTSPIATIPRGTRPAAPRGLFKADRPRTIDRFIDYFGGGAPWFRPAEAPADGALHELEHATEEGRRHVPMAG